MRFAKETITAKFIDRPNRFKAFVELDGETVVAHVPNTGRNREILVPGCTVVLRKEDSPARKTKFSLIAGYKGNKLINIDSQIPNHVVEEALYLGLIEELKGYGNVMREKTYGKSRFDFLLEDSDRKFYLEVKGVTLESDGVASFPDAPTERGAKHVRELMDALSEGHGAGILFLVQIEDVKLFTPAYTLDPEFSEVLKEAREKGVKVMAYRCKVTESSLDVIGSIPVLI
jgi:sugar fermentation stimulation protein A